jgi:drug/metabolite transporter (DMT)-like permease
MRGFFYLLLSGILLGTVGIFVKLIGPNVTPYLLASIRILAAAGLIWIFLASERRTKLLKLAKGDLRVFALAGLFGVVFGFGFYVKSFTLIPVANAVFLMYIYPVVTAVLAKIFLDEKVSEYTVLALGFALGGVYLIYGQGVNIFASAEGSLYALIAGLGYSVFIVSMRYMENKGHSYWDVVFWPLLLGGIMLLPLNLTAPITFLPFTNVVLLIAGMVFISTFLGYLLYACGLKTVMAKHATVIETLAEPASAVFFAWLILGEVVPQYIFAGGFLIILANIVVRLDMKKEHFESTEGHRKKI